MGTMATAPRRRELLWAIRRLIATLDNWYPDEVTVTYRPWLPLGERLAIRAGS